MATFIFLLWLVVAATAKPMGPQGQHPLVPDDATIDELLAKCEPECHMNACQLAEHNGFKCATHEVETKDGYILGVQRIGSNPNGAPVLLVHGLLCSATNWLTNLRDQSLAYILSDAGYDVWTGNVRGNTYSRKHKTMDPDSKDFWQFSWDQHAMDDLPSMINYILKTTAKERIYYVGHSQGTLLAFAGLPKNPEVMKKVKGFFALGPVSRPKNIQGLFKYIAPWANTIGGLVRLLGNGEFLGSSWIIKILGQTMCSIFGIKEVCNNVLFLVAGMDKLHLNQTRLPVYLSHTPAGTSVRNFIHFSQLIQTRKFQAFDYGSKSENQKHYKQDTPPAYSVSGLTVPTYLFWGGKDWLSTPEAVQELIPKIPNLRGNNYIADYDHLDFTWGINANTKVYHKIRDAMNQLEKEENFGEKLV